MPLFGTRREPSPEPIHEPAQTSSEPRKYGLFGRREPSPPPEPVYEDSSSKKGSLFSRRDPSPERVQQPAYEEPAKKQGLFRRRAASPSPTTSTRASDRTSVSSSTYHTANHHSDSGSTRRGGVLHRTFGHGNDGYDDDASVLEARERVHSAEAAEREADLALDEARASVRDARERVKQLEEEAREEARRAKIKQHQAREVSKLGRALGREYSLCEACA